MGQNEEKKYNFVYADLNVYFSLVFKFFLLYFMRMMVVFRNTK